jgi:thymidylate synthase
MEQAYLSLLQEVLENGEERMDRTGVGTKSVFGRQIRCNLRNSFPLITTKKVPFKAVLGEVLWFVEGSGDERRLAEITFGTRDHAQKTIWSPNAEYTTGSKFVPKFPGDLGRVYGVQWRHWKHHAVRSFSEALEHPEGGTSFYGASVLEQEVDQLKSIVNKLRTNPADRRMILTAFNPGEMDDMALPPCHMFAQFHTSEKKKELDCLMYIRSNDLFLGLPFNIASYALLTEMLAKVTGYVPGDLIITIGDAHIYMNHIDQVKEQLSRKPFTPPQLGISKRLDLKEIDDFKMDDFMLLGYKSHESIKAKMAQ